MRAICCSHYSLAPNAVLICLVYGPFWSPVLAGTGHGAQPLYPQPASPPMVPPQKGLVVTALSKAWPACHESLFSPIDQRILESMAKQNHVAKCSWWLEAICTQHPNGLQMVKPSSASARYRARLHLKSSLRAEVQAFLSVLQVTRDDMH